MSSSKKEVAEFGGRLWKETLKLNEISWPRVRLQDALTILERVLKKFYNDLEPSDDGHPAKLSELLANRKQAFDPGVFSDLKRAIRLRNNRTHDGASVDPSIEWEDADNQRKQEYLDAIDTVVSVIREHLEQLFFLHGLKLPTANHVSESKAGYQIDSNRLRNELELPSRPAQNDVPPPVIRGQSFLKASPDDHVVIASALAEHLFCPRAGIIQNTINYRHVQQEIPALYILPWYEIDRIRDELNSAVWGMWAYLGSIAFITAAFNTFGVVKTNGDPFLLAGFLIAFAFALAFCVKKLATHWKRRAELLMRLSQFEDAAADEPNPSNHEMQPVNWWSLLKSDFEVTRPQRSFEHSDWKLTGKPDRVLVKGSLRVPVFEMKASSGQLKRPETKHIAKAVAYCKLLQHEMHESPYAVVLCEGRYSGFTVSAYSDENLRIFETALAQLRTSVKSPVDPSEPSDDRCKHCPHGKATRYSDGEVFEKNRTAVAIHKLRRPARKRSSTEHTFHTVCGDYFKWKPKSVSCEQLVEISPQKSI